MAIHEDGPAPYAPPHAVLTVIDFVRQRTIPSAFTNETMIRMGISESLASRTVQSLKQLDLVSDDGAATDNLTQLQRAKEAEFKDFFAEYLQRVYADIFAFIDPAKAEFDVVCEQFRGNTPNRQRDRMAKLFLGLCERAGIVEASPVRPRTSKNSTRPPSTRATPSTARNGTSSKAKRTPPKPPTPNSDLPLVITGVLQTLPPTDQGWTEKKRQRFLTAFEAVLDLCYPIIEEKQGELFNADG